MSAAAADPAVRAATAAPIRNVLVFITASILSKKLESDGVHGTSTETKMMSPQGHSPDEKAPLRPGNANKGRGNTAGQRVTVASRGGFTGLHDKRSLP